MCFLHIVHEVEKSRTLLSACATTGSNHASVSGRDLERKEAPGTYVLRASKPRAAAAPPGVYRDPDLEAESFF